MDALKMIDWRLATGAITVTEYDQLKARITSTVQSQKDGANGRISTGDIDHHVRLYSIYRSYIEHENGLIDQRLTWNFSIQGLLFAAYAFAFQKTAELWTALSDGTTTTPAGNATVALTPARLAYVLYSLKDIHIFLFVLAIMGALVSMVVMLSTKAASAALLALEERWHAIYPEYKISVKKTDTHGDIPPGLPGLMGGGDYAAAHFWGFRAAQFLPVIFILAWVVLAVSVGMDYAYAMAQRGI